MGVGGGGDAGEFSQDCCMIMIDDGRMGIPCPGPAAHPLMVYLKGVVMVPGQGTQYGAGSSPI